MSEKLAIGFVYSHAIRDRDEIIDKGKTKNKIPDAGLEKLLKAPFGDATPLGPLYIGLFRNNALVTDSTKATDIPAVLGEFTSYEGADRKAWNRLYGAGAYSSQHDPAVFKFLVDQTIYGAFLVTEAEKGSGSGLLVSAVRFSTPRLIYAGLELEIAPTLAYISAEL